MSVAPLFFVGHGSPMFAVGTGEATDNLAKQSKRFLGRSKLRYAGPKHCQNRLGQPHGVLPFSDSNAMTRATAGRGHNP
jgi:hypothetical protein